MICASTLVGSAKVSPLRPHGNIVRDFAQRPVKLNDLGRLAICGPSWAPRPGAVLVAGRKVKVRAGGKILRPHVKLGVLGRAVRGVGNPAVDEGDSGTSGETTSVDGYDVGVVNAVGKPGDLGVCRAAAAEAAFSRNWSC